jgi:hypothetical protein
VQPMSRYKACLVLSVYPATFKMTPKQGPIITPISQGIFFFLVALGIEPRALHKHPTF